MQDKRETVSSLPELFNVLTQKYGNRICALIGKKSLTFNSWEESADSVSGCLSSLNIHDNSRIAVLSESRIEWPGIFRGILQSGHTAVCLDPLSSIEEIRYILEHTEAPVLLIPDEYYTKFEYLGEKIDSLLHCIRFSDAANSAAAETDYPVISAGHPAIIIYTSGTMGSQKGVVLSHKNILSNIRAGFKAIDFEENFTVLNLLPLSHMFGLTAGLFIPLYNGAKVVFTESLKSDIITKTIQQSKPDAIAAVPLMLKLFYRKITEGIEKKGLLTHRFFSISRSISVFMNHLRLPVPRALFSGIHRLFGKNLKFIVSGGGPLDPEIETFFSTIGMPILNGYGLTETSPIVSVQRQSAYVPGSVGKPVDGVEVKLNGSDELLVRGPNLMAGYYKDSETTSSVLQNGWFNTGDIAELGKDGSIFLKGRGKNVIVTEGGLNIFPEEIEGILSKSSIIREVCILGQSGASGETPLAVIFPESSLSGETQETLNAKLKDELKELQKNIPSWKQVRDFRITDRELPKTTTRKIKRGVLKEWVSRGIPEQSSAQKELYVDPFTGNIIDVLGKWLSINPETIHPDSRLQNDLGIDSLMRIDLLSVLEQKTRIIIPEEEACWLETISDLSEKAASYRDHPPEQGNRFLESADTDNTSGLISDSFFFRLTRGCAYFAYSLWIKIYFRLRIHGKEHIPADGAFILSANHTSLLDFPVLISSFPRRIRKRVTAPAAKDYFFRHPVLAFFISCFFRAFPLERLGNYIEGLKTCASILKTGSPVVLFPEGTRSLEGNLLPFKPGIGMLSSELNIPILPVYIDGAYRALRKGTWFPRPYTIRVTIGKPVYPEHSDSSDSTDRNAQYRKITSAVRTEIERIKEEVSGVSNTDSR